MLIHQVPSQVVKFQGESLPEYPADVEFVAQLGPAELFGLADLTGRLCSHPPGTEVCMVADLHRGGIRCEPGSRLPSPNVAASLFDAEVSLAGDAATVTLHCSNEQAFHTGLRVVQNHLPASISSALGEPVDMIKLSGIVGGQPFVVEYKGSCYRTFRVPDVNKQITDELVLMKKLPADAAPRIFAARRYLVQARWLRYLSEYPTQFAGERLLNVYKAIEVLLGRTVDTMKPMLESLGLNEETVEIVAGLTYVRDQVDVGHPAVSTLTPEQYDGMQRYVLAVEDVVTWLVKHIVAALHAGTFKLPFDDSGSGGSRRAKTIETVVRWTESVNHLRPGAFLKE